MYAVVELQGHQYIVSESAEIVVDKIDMAEGESFETEVLAVFSEDGKTTKIGKPFVEGSHAAFQIKSHQRGTKIDVVKFKRKNRYEKHYGHRSYQTILTVTAING